MVKVEVPCGDPPPALPALVWPELSDDETYHVHVDTARKLFLLLAKTREYFEQQRVCHAEKVTSPASQPTNVRVSP